MTGCNPATPAGTGTCTCVPVLSSQCTPTYLRHHSKHAHHRAESLRCSTVRWPPRRVVGRPHGGHRITMALDESTTLAPLRHHITNRTSPGHPTGGSLHVARSPNRMVFTRTTTSPLPPRRRVTRLRSSHHDTMLPGHAVASHWHSLWPRVRTPVCLVTLGHHVTFGLHSYTDTLDCIVSFLTPPHQSPCTIRSRAFLVYDMISSLSCIRYDLLVLSCTISISEPPLLQYLGLGEFRSLST